MQLPNTCTITGRNSGKQRQIFYSRWISDIKKGSSCSGLFPLVTSGQYTDPNPFPEFLFFTPMDLRPTKILFERLHSNCFRIEFSLVFSFTKTQRLFNHRHFLANFESLKQQLFLMNCCVKSCKYMVHVYHIYFLFRWLTETWSKRFVWCKSYLKSILWSFKNLDQRMPIKNKTNEVNTGLM